jgi:hypothetical protein
MSKKKRPAWTQAQRKLSPTQLGWFQKIVGWYDEHCGSTQLLTQGDPSYPARPSRVLLEKRGLLVHRRDNTVRLTPFGRQLGYWLSIADL